MEIENSYCLYCKKKLTTMELVDQYHQSCFKIVNDFNNRKLVKLYNKIQEFAQNETTYNFEFDFKTINFTIYPFSIVCFLVFLLLEGIEEIMTLVILDLFQTPFLSELLIGTIVMIPLFVGYRIFYYHFSGTW